MKKTPKATSGKGNGGGGISIFKNRRKTPQEPVPDANANGDHGTAELDKGTSPPTANTANEQSTTNFSDDSNRFSETLETEINSAEVTPTPKKATLQGSTTAESSNKQGLLRKITTMNSQPFRSPNGQPFSGPNTTNDRAMSFGADPFAETQEPRGTEFDTMALETHDLKQNSMNSMTYAVTPEGRHHASNTENLRARSPHTVLPVPIADKTNANLIPTATMAPPAPRPAFLNKITAVPTDRALNNNAMSSSYLNDADEKGTLGTMTAPHTNTAFEPALMAPGDRPDSVEYQVDLQNETYHANETFMNMDETQLTDQSTMDFSDGEPSPHCPTEKAMDEMSFSELVKEFDKNLTIANDQDVILQSEFLEARVAVGAATAEYLKFKGLEWEITNRTAHDMSELEKGMLSCAR